MSFKSPSGKSAARPFVTGRGGAIKSPNAKPEYRAPSNRQVATNSAQKIRAQKIPGSMTPSRTLVDRLQPDESQRCAFMLLRPQSVNEDEFGLRIHPAGDCNELTVEAARVAHIFELI